MQKNHLELDRCPHCNVAKPLLLRVWGATTQNYAKENGRSWANYQCSNCGGVVLTCAQSEKSNVSDIWPQPQAVHETVPNRAREFLSQAISSLHAPSGAIMLTASAVDAMLKDKGYRDGDLYSRIDAAAHDHLITSEMAAWAHEVRLDANDQRHADERANLPNETDARKVIEFTQALAQFLYVLPARVERGRKDATN